MAHFAELNGKSIVQRVVVVNNNVLLDENGNEQESLGIEFLKYLYGNTTLWVQTSYNNNFRKRFAGVGYTYNRAYDAFIKPIPNENYTLNTETLEWELVE
jgi:hypothetical protein